jgi:hypothetical protein
MDANVTVGASMQKNVRIRVRFRVEEATLYVEAASTHRSGRPDALYRLWRVRVLCQKEHPVVLSFFSTHGSPSWVHVVAWLSPFGGVR